MQRIKYADYPVGTEIPGLSTGPVHHMDLVRYSGASGDFNPIHTDPVFAKEVGLENGTIAHGMYVMAQMARCYNDWVTPLQVASFKVKFKGMTLPGEMIVCSGKVKRVNEESKQVTVALQATNENGDIKVAGNLIINAD